MPLQITKELVEQYHQALPQQIRAYLNQRCISDKTIDKFKLGWDGKRIAIPIQDDAGDYVYFKSRKDPQDSCPGAKYLYPKDAKAQIYGWENLTFSKPYIIVCEGELDRLVLEDNGLPAVTSTGGAGTFEKEWVSYFSNILDVYLCYDNDDAGIAGVKRIIELISRAKIVKLPDMGEEKKDITDYFASGYSKEDFIALMAQAITSEELKLQSELDLLASQDELQVFYPSQDFIGNKFYYTIPMPERDTESKHNVFRQKFIVINSDRKILSLDSVGEFYEKYGLYIRQLPAIKNPEIRWSYKHIKEFVEGFISEPYKVFTGIRNVVQKYGELKEEGWYDIIPLWSLGSYIYCLFETYPYLGFCGMKGTGKSKMARLLSFLTFNGNHIISIKEATIFRDVESQRATMCIDESEDLWDPKNNQAVRSLLNAGYCKGGRVPRQEGDTKKGYYTRYYEVYSAKVISNIRGFEDVLGSRVLTITMLLAKTSKGHITIRNDSENWSKLRHEQYSFGLSFSKEVREAYLNDPDTKVGSNRFNDLWSPMLSIGKVVFKDRPDEFERIKEFARGQIAKASENSLDERDFALLRALKDIVKYDGKFSNKEIKDAMAPYLDDEDLMNIKPYWIGYKLKGFDLKKKARQHYGIVYDFKKEEVEDVYERYLPEGSLPAETLQTLQTLHTLH